MVHLITECLVKMNFKTTVECLNRPAELNWGTFFSCRILTQTAFSRFNVFT